MAEIPDSELLEMRRILRACMNRFRQFERAERLKVENDPLSLVEAREASAAAEKHKVYAEACEKFAAPDECVDGSV